MWADVPEHCFQFADTHKHAERAGSCSKLSCLHKGGIAQALTTWKAEGKLFHTGEKKPAANSGFHLPFPNKYKNTCLDAFNEMPREGKEVQWQRDFLAKSFLGLPYHIMREQSTDQPSLTWCSPDVWGLQLPEFVTSWLSQTFICNLTQSTNLILLPLKGWRKLPVLREKQETDWCIHAGLSHWQSVSIWWVSSGLVGVSWWQQWIATV